PPALSSPLSLHDALPILLDGVRPVAEATSDLTTGNLRSTGNTMDVAVDGGGFFVVSTPNGERYTRGGSFRLDDKHQLVDANGRPDRKSTRLNSSHRTISY